MKKHIYKNRLWLLSLLATLISLSSCTHYYYAPNSQNVPLFQEEKEIRFSGSISSGDEFEGTELQGAMSITKNVGIMANGFFVNPQDGNEWGKGNLIEIGAGYFKPLNKYFVFETYGGFGWGSATNQYGLGITSSVNFNRYFIQPSIGFTSKWFDIAISSRLCGLEFTNIDYVNDIDLYDKEDLDYIQDNKFSILFEPALTIRGGWKYIKVQSQIVLSTNLNNPELMQEEINGNIGFYFIITDKYRSTHGH